MALVKDSHAVMHVDLNPHGNTKACIACHQSAHPRSNTTTPEQINPLCQSCHKSLNMFHQLHANDGKFSTTTNRTWPHSFPHRQDQMTCLTCHDTTWQCQSQPQDAPNKNWLRLREDNREFTLCQSCHPPLNHDRFNVHSQYQEGKLVIETCQWCHSEEDDIMTSYEQGKQPKLRQNATDLCINCHHIAKDHPSGTPHVGTLLPQTMRWYIGAQEMKSTMCLPLEALKKYARATNHPLQTIPLDNEGRLTCVSCHNPHEKGLWATSEIRARGSEPAQATNHRLRIGRGKQCLGCHEK